MQNDLSVEIGHPFDGCIAAYCAGHLRSSAGEEESEGERGVVRMRKVQASMRE